MEREHGRRVERYRGGKESSKDVPGKGLERCEGVGGC